MLDCGMRNTECGILNFAKRKRALLAAVLLSMLLAGCAPREVLLPLLRIEPPALRAFPADFEAPFSSETNRLMPGFGGGGSGVTRTPILFVHGNTVSARFWLPARRHFLAQGWNPDELWAFGTGRDSVRSFDSNDLSAPGIGRAVDAMTAYLSKMSGREIRQIDIVAHSLGVTAVRQWMKQDNAWHRVRVFVAVAGANHGVWTARADARGQNRVSSFELAPGSPWLEQLNRGGETPGPTRYLTLYDGSGYGDVLFPRPYEHSPRLEGAVNLAFNVEHDSALDHLELPRSEETVAVIADFLRAAGEPLPNEPPPVLLREGDVVRALSATARVECATVGAYPGRTRPARESWTLSPDALTTCYASDARSGLSSAMQRYRSASRPAAPATFASANTALALSADPAAGQFENPLLVTLRASEADADIYYTTTGSEPNTGSPLYAEPVFVAAPLSLRAVAIAADGRRSEEIRMRYGISLELLQARHSLQRQLEPDLPPLKDP